MHQDHHKLLQQHSVHLQLPEQHPVHLKHLGGHLGHHHTIRRLQQLPGEEHLQKFMQAPSIQVLLTIQQLEHILLGHLDLTD